MEEDRKIMVEDGPQNREAVRESIARKLSKPTVYRSIDIDVQSEEAQKRSQAQAAMDAMQAQAQKNEQKDLSKVASDLAQRLSAQESSSTETIDETDQPKSESGLAGAYKSMMRGLGFKVD